MLRMKYNLEIKNTDIFIKPELDAEIDNKMLDYKDDEPDHLKPGC